MRVRVGSQTVGYEVEGQGPEAIVFLPALGTTRDMWWPQVAFFRSRYLVVSCDTGGHDPVPTGMAGRSLADFAEEVGAVLQAVGLRDCHLVGLSLGGMIAQLFAARYPEQVASLVLASTRSSYPEDGREQLRQRAEVAETEGMRPLVDATLSRWFTQDHLQAERASVERVRQMLGTADPRAYAEAARAAAQLDTAGDLPWIGAPTLVVRGDQDPGVPAQAAEELRRSIPGAEGVTIVGASHLCNVQRRDEFNAAVSRLVEQVRATRSESDRIEPLAPW